MKLSKRYFLSLDNKEKLKMLDTLLRSDFHSYMILSKLYLDAPVSDGGMETEVIDREFKRSLNRKYYLEKRKLKR
jgi:hypothetical protein